MGAVTVNMVSADLSHEETILQIADALDTLDKVTNHLFDRLQKNIEANCTRLDSLDGRVQTAAKKVEMLQDSKKATCVYSSAKYPASDYTPSQTAFPLEDIFNFQRQLHFSNDKATVVNAGGQKVNEKPPGRYRSAKPIKRSLDNRDLNEKLHFYHIKPKSKSANQRWNANKTNSLTPNSSGQWNQEHRCVVSSINSVSSLLVYNTDDNVFRSEDKRLSKQPIETKSINNNSSNKYGSDRNTNTELGIAEAPDSLASSNHGDMMDGGGLLYVPELADLPEFEMLPDFLDLPNIAFDESYASLDGNTLSSIAPSVNYHQPVLQGENSKDNENSKKNSSVSSVKENDRAPNLETNARSFPNVAHDTDSRSHYSTPAPPPPPPPPPSEAPPSMPQDLSPPPPPPPEIVIDQTTKTGDDVIDIGGNNPTAPSTEGGRSDLLAAIRASGGVGGKGLKKASERQTSVANTEDSSSSNSPSTGGGGGLDLMGEIARKLAMRRKGMSGKADQEGGLGNRNVSKPTVPKPSSAMDKISSMIPPPPPSNDAPQKNEESDDDDW